MISTPRRSVTRFFIPLIDVLILLFCIFLLMPFVSVPVKPEDDKDEASPLPPDVARLKAERDAAIKERDLATGRLERLQKNRVVRVLDIDPKTGALYYMVQNERKTVPEKAGLPPEQEDKEVEQWIELQKQQAREKSPYFVIRYPRVASGHPAANELKKYGRWFQNVEHGYDRP